MSSFSSLVLCVQERIIERLKEQREREEREKGEEVESSKKELKELREKVSQLQGDLADREVEDTHIRTKAEKHTLSSPSLCPCQKNMIDLSLQNRFQILPKSSH